MKAWRRWSFETGLAAGRCRQPVVMRKTAAGRDGVSGPAPATAAANPRSVEPTLSEDSPMAPTRSTAPRRMVTVVHRTLPLLRHVLIAVVVDALAAAAHVGLAVRIALVVVVIAADRLVCRE